MITVSWVFRKSRHVHRGCTALLVMLVTACASAPPPLQDEPPAWSLQFERPIEFQLLIHDELLVVGTTRHLYGIDPATGIKLWRKRNIVATSRDLVSLGKNSYILVNDAAGGAFNDRDTNILALDEKTGEIVWESRLLEGKILQGALSESKELLFFTTVVNPHGDDRGFLSGTLGRKGLGSGFKQQPYLNAMEVATGKVLWQRAFHEAVPMSPSRARQLDENAEWSDIRSFDLSLYRQPFATDKLVCLTYAGINCYHARTGEPAWQDRFSVIKNDLALSYSNPMKDQKNIITTGEKRVRAYDLNSGKLVWRSRRFGIIPELMVGKQLVYGQLGGRFFNFHKEKWQWKGKFGVFALNKATGKTVWKYNNANDAISNLLVYRRNIWLADEHRLIALDRFDGDKQFSLRHKFKRPPVYIALNEVGHILVVGEGEAAAFDPQQGKLLWHVQHPPVGPGAWRRFSMALLHASGNILKFGSFVLARGGSLMPSLSIPLGTVDFKIINTKRIVANSLGRSGRRMTYQSGSTGSGVGNANLSGNYQYFVTQPKGQKHVALAVVNLSRGKTERMIRMDADRPNLVIDEGNNKIFEIFGRQIVALPLVTSVSRRVAQSQP